MSTATFDQPRRRDGEFTFKSHSAPELTLDRPSSDDLERLSGLGFVVSNDQPLIDSYTVEPGIWLQSMSEPTLSWSDLSEGQQAGALRAVSILDERRGVPASVQDVPWHSIECFEEDLGSAAVYIKSAPESWTADVTTMRVLLDYNGGAVDVREGVKSEHGGTVWNEL